jgi:acetyltransferase-like isoleucine patch superfamily enzyme
LLPKLVEDCVNLRRYVATSDRFPAVVARKLYRALQNFSLPAPRILVVPALRIFLLIRAVYYFVWRVFVCEPLFKAYCTKYGRNLHTGVYIHWIQGKGEIIVGDNVTFDGKSSFSFPARYSVLPALSVGDNSYIGHGCGFTVGCRVTVGCDCLFAVGVRILDTPGHPTAPEQRLKRLPAPNEAVRPVVIGDNVWIGAFATILPGVVIGSGSVIGTGAVVTKSVPENTLVAGNPARVIRSLAGGETTDQELIGKEVRNS